MAGSRAVQTRNSSEFETAFANSVIYRVPAVVTSLRLSRCATSMTLTSAAQSSCPTSVRPYQTVGGDVGLVERAMIASNSSFADGWCAPWLKLCRYPAEV